MSKTTLWAALINGGHKNEFLNHYTVAYTRQDSKRRYLGGIGEQYHASFLKRAKFVKVELVRVEKP